MVSFLKKASAAAMLVFATMFLTISVSAEEFISSPTNLTVTLNDDAGIDLDWDDPNLGTYSAERYAIAFGMNGSYPYAIATGNVGGANSLNTYYTVSCSYLINVFKLEDCLGTFNFKIRADNDTSAKYSRWSNEASITITNTVSKAEYDALFADYEATLKNYNAVVEQYKALQSTYTKDIDSLNSSISGYIAKVDSLTAALLAQESVKIANQKTIIEDRNKSIAKQTEALKAQTLTIEELEKKVADSTAS
jgi:hypothetical protein